MNKPLMIFDGDCGFCRRWIHRWNIITGSSIDYEPYQKVAAAYPQIPEENFKKSVQLVEGTKITSGAEAVFRSLSYNKGHRWFLWLYEKLPLFRLVSEAFYKVVAQNRVLFSNLTFLLWGDRLEPSTYKFSTFLFIRVLALIYAVAFLSLGSQILGLIGSQGISPVSMFLEQVRLQLGGRAFWVMPTLAWLQSGDGFLLFLSYGGFFLATVLFIGIAPNIVLFLLWAFYLSLVNAGQEFLAFQWDNLLLETGFFAIFLAPITFWDKGSRNYDPPAAVRFILKWLLFRLVFLSGVVKLLSGDPAWHTLTALQYHYETQPLPPWTAWYAHLLPGFLHKVSAFLMFAAELFIPLLFFFPRRPRMAACFISIFFQLLICLTGNYCFFNFLTIALSFLLLDDAFWFDRKIIAVESKGVLLERKFLPVITLPLLFIVLWVSIGQMAWIWQKDKNGQPFRSRNFLEQVISPFRTVNSYGLFAVMTTERNEIIVEGSADGSEWLEYEFKYKPGDLSKRPAFVQPHQPRLDWQMWFAALGSYRQNPWFINFGIRLMQGSPVVLKLLEKNPFPDAPPKYVRASFYRYRFASPEDKKDYKVWWKREEKGNYCPAMSLTANA